jgi:methionyl-tRNA formyltransferase
VPSLESLHEAGHEIDLVITQPDRPARRGLKLTPSPVKLAAQRLGLEVSQPERIRDPQIVDRLRILSPDVMVVVAYGQIIPASVLSIPRYGVINVHASLLPRHRGAAPIARAILEGDRETGVTIMQMDEKLDHGPVLASTPTPIGEREDAIALTSRLAVLGAECLVHVLEDLDRIGPVPQNEVAATTAPKVRKEDGELDWDMGAVEIDRHVRALQPWPGATLPTAKGRVKILSGHVEGDRYVPDMVQVPGKKPASARQVLRDA